MPVVQSRQHLRPRNQSPRSCTNRSQGEACLVLSAERRAALSAGLTCASALSIGLSPAHSLVHPRVLDGRGTILLLLQHDINPGRTNSELGACIVTSAKQLA